MFDNDDLFGGTPENKFFEILCVASKDLVEKEIESVYKRLAAMEMLMDDPEMDQKIATLALEEPDKLEQAKQNLFMHSSVNIISSHDS